MLVWNVIRGLETYVPFWLLGIAHGFSVAGLRGVQCEFTKKVLGSKQSRSLSHTDACF